MNKELLDQSSDVKQKVNYNLLAIILISLIVLGEILRFLHWPFGFQLIAIGTGGILGFLLAKFIIEFSRMYLFFLAITFFWIGVLYYQGFRVSSLFYLVPSLILMFILVKAFNRSSS